MLSGLVVSVDYADLLERTLPHSRKHFDRLVVVTTHEDAATADVARTWNCDVLRTDAFYRDEALFNKGAAISEGLAMLGQHGWTVLFDADVIMPDDIAIPNIQEGYVYSPRRRMCVDPDAWDGGMDWAQFPVYRDAEKEFAGYFIAFYSADQHAQPWPNYPTNWKMANCDSDFHNRWPDARKIRPSFHVLHLGQAGINWAGRSTEARHRQRDLMRLRSRYGDLRFEKLRP